MNPDIKNIIEQCEKILEHESIGSIKKAYLEIAFHAMKAEIERLIMENNRLAKERESVEWQLVGLRNNLREYEK